MPPPKKKQLKLIIGDAKMMPPYEVQIGEARMLPTNADVRSGGESMDPGTEVPPPEPSHFMLPDGRVMTLGPAERGHFMLPDGRVVTLGPAQLTTGKDIPMGSPRYSRMPSEADASAVQEYMSPRIPRRGSR